MKKYLLELVNSIDDDELLRILIVFIKKYTSHSQKEESA